MEVVVSFLCIGIVVLVKPSYEKLTYKLCSNKKIVLNVASSGIAYLLFPRGRTTYFQFSIPLTGELCCGIKKGIEKAELLQQTSLVIWDESHMVSLFAFEALDCTIRNLVRFTIDNSMEKPF